MLTQQKMLLIDGDEGIRKSLALFFGSRNCRLHTVENAAQALTAINHTLYDIIICEELLPDMNGLNFYKILNNRCYQGIKILITWYGNSSTLDLVRQKDIDFLLTKPFSGEDVEAAMISLITARAQKNRLDSTGKANPAGLKG